MTDRRTVQTVIVFLGLTTMAGLAAIVGLLALDTPVEAVVIVGQITSTALGALGSTLVSTRSAPDTRNQRPEIPVEFPESYP